MCAHCCWESSSSSSTKTEFTHNNNNKNARILDTSSSPALHFTCEQKRVERGIRTASRNPTIPRLGRELMGESIYILPYKGRSMSVIKFTFDILCHTVYCTHRARNTIRTKNRRHTYKTYCLCLFFTLPRTDNTNAYIF